MPQTLTSTPQADGFRMPGEFEPHRQCWMLYPVRSDVWRDDARPAQHIFSQVAEAISRFEPVTVGVDATHVDHARNNLPAHIRVVEMAYNDAWVRDSGPTFVVNDAGDVRGVDWQFNAWGGEIYADWSLDEKVAQTILDHQRIDRYQADFVLEGGSIHVDGEGTLITTRECLLNPNRNPRLTQDEIESRLKSYLNVDKVIWLDYGVYEDETSGHVDNVICFVKPGVIALTWTDDPHDAQYERSVAAYEQLKSETDANGRRLEVHKIHQPAPMHMTQAESGGLQIMEGTYPRLAGARLAASYINFYIANGGLIVPQFDDPYDDLALETLDILFPERQVVGIPAREILLGGGNIHCITQQQPR